MRFRRHIPALLLMLGVTAAFADGPGPIGSEFEVDGSGSAYRPVGFPEAGGAYVVLWDGSPYADAAELRRYDATGAPIAPASPLSPPTRFVDAGRDAAGNFVITEWNFDGSSYGVVGQRFDASGSALAPVFQVNTTTAGRQDPTGIGVNAAGGFMITWESHAQAGVFAQVFDATSSLVGGELLVTPSSQSDGSNVIADGAGNFVVAWHEPTVSAFDVFARRYDGTGTALGPEFQVNAYTTGDQAAPAMAALSGGGFIIVWSGDGPGSSGVFGKRYDASGVPMGGEFTVSTFPGATPSVAVGSGGDFVVTWLSNFGSDDTLGVRARSFDNAAVPLAPDFQVNTYTQGFSHNPHAVVHPSGEFTVVWDTDDIGIRGQRCNASGPFAGDVPISGQRLVIRDPPDPSRRRINFGTRDASSVNGLTPAVRPDVQGMYLHVYNNATGDSACLPLPASGWDAYDTLDDPFFYKDPTFANGPCNKAKLTRNKRFYATCKGAGISYTLNEPSQSTVAVAAILGNARYCTVFGDIAKDGDGVYRARNGLALPTCPVPLVPCP